MTSQILILVGFITFIAILMMLLFASRYKRCPANKILVVYGKTLGEQSAMCYAGGGTFVWPVIQDYKYLDLAPINVEVNLRDALKQQNIRSSLPAKFKVAVSNKPGMMIIAAERLLGLDQSQIKALAHDIITSQIVIEINNVDVDLIKKEKFVNSIYIKVGHELKKVGLELINVNMNVPQWRSINNTL